MSIQADSDVKADVQAVFQAVAQGIPVDPDVAARVQERAMQITSEIYRKHGILDIAVDLIREAREE